MRPTDDPTDAQLDRLLGDSPELGVSEREAMLESILTRTTVSPPLSAFGRLRWLVAGTALVVFPALYFAVLRGEGEQLVARGAAFRPSFSMSCIVEGRAAPCQRGGKLVFLVAPAGFEAFAAIARTPDGTTLWLFPSAVDASSVDVRRLGSGGALDEAVLLDGQPGAYVVQGIFSHAPLSRDAVRAALLDPLAAGVTVTSQRFEVP